MTKFTQERKIARKDEQNKERITNVNTYGDKIYKPPFDCVF